MSDTRGQTNRMNRCDSSPSYLARFQLESRRELYIQLFQTMNEWDFRGSSHKSIEVGKIFDLVNSSYHNDIRRTKGIQKPICGYDNPRLLQYLQWLLWECGGVTAPEGYAFIPEENLSNYT